MAGWLPCLGTGLAQNDNLCFLSCVVSQIRSAERCLPAVSLPQRHAVPRVGRFRGTYGPKKVPRLTGGRPRRAGQVAVKTGPAHGRARGGADTLWQLPGSHNWGGAQAPGDPYFGSGRPRAPPGQVLAGGPCGHADSATRFQTPLLLQPEHLTWSPACVCLFIPERWAQLCLPPGATGRDESSDSCHMRLTLRDRFCS